MAERRVYTGVSAKAVKGLKRLSPEREIYVSTAPGGKGYTVITKDKDERPSKAGVKG